MAEFSVIGRSVPDIDADERVTGSAQYTMDVQLPGMLHSKILTSPHPHARVKSIDTSRAEALSGVKAVVTYKDFVGMGAMDYGNIVPQDHPAIPQEVLFVGDLVAAVAATDKDIAEAATKLIHVEYDVLPFVLDPLEAQKKDAPKLHTDLTKNNVVTTDPYRVDYGDIAAGFAAADHIIEHTMTTAKGSGCSAEPRVVVAKWDAYGRLTVWASNQSLFANRDMLAKMFGMPAKMVRVICRYAGGGFGNKTTYVEMPIAAMLAKKAGKPVKLAFIQQEEINNGRQRHASVQTVKVGFKNDGTITAVHQKAVLDTGAYSGHGVWVAQLIIALLESCKWFKCANVKGESYLLYTNTPVACAYRGVGTPQGCYATELMFDKVAEALNMDPVEFRLKNVELSAEEAWKTKTLLPKTYTMPECIRRAAEAVEWKKKWKGWNTPVAVNGAKKTGIGIAVFAMGWGDTGGNAVTLRLSYQDGSVSVYNGTVDLGAGHKTVLAQAVAEVVGVKYEDVNILVAHGDTDLVPYSGETSGDEKTHTCSIAAKAAGEQLKAQLFSSAAAMLGVTPAELDARDSKIFIKGAPQKSVSHASAAARLGQDTRWGGGTGHDLVSTASVESPNTYPSVSPVVSVAEVEVDTETGAVEVLRLVIAFDVGRAINPRGCVKQIQGAAIEAGIPFALIEEILIDRSSGAALNSNWLDFKKLYPLDAPPVEVILLESGKADDTAWGAHGIGNAGVMSTIPAIANAVRNAVGVEFLDLPITPDKVLKALGKV